MQKLSISNIKLPEGELWLDTGILFPFFNKQVKTNYQRWAQDIMTLARNQPIYTTSLVRDEITRIFVRWNPKKRQEASSIYKKIMSMIEIKDIPAEPEGRLSKTDVSLLKRSGGILITSDKLLYETDTAAAVLVSLDVIEHGFQYEIKFTAKNL